MTLKMKNTQHHNTQCQHITFFRHKRKFNIKMNAENNSRSTVAMAAV